jgi:glycosyltransferase involved in cell wall biosynthesis
MKILQVSHGLPPKEMAGVELYTFYLSKALVHQKHQVHVFCREEDPAKEEFSSREEEMDGLRVTRVVNNLTRINGPRIYYENHFFDQIFLKTLEQEKPDLVHFQHFIALSAHLVRAAKEEGYPVVMTLHDFFTLCHRIHLLKEDNRLCRGPLYGLECVSCLDMEPMPRDLRTRCFLKGKDLLPFPFIKWTKRFFIPPKYIGTEGYEVFHRYRYMYELFKIPEVLLTPSVFVRDQLLRYYPSFRSKTKVFPLGIFPIEGQRRSVPGNGRIRFCYFGNILPLKGVHLLIDAFKTLPTGKAHLTIYGSRNPWTETYYDRLKESSNGFSIDFRGFFRRESLADALSDQDVVILPSLCHESFSFVIREANDMGLPVIASKMGAIPETVKEGANGYLFKPGNRDDLKRCMLRFIEQPALAEEMSSRMPKVKTMVEHAAELRNLYEEILRKRG